MLPSTAFLKDRLAQVVPCMAAQGHEVAGLQTELERLPDSYDALAAFADRLARLPLRADWAYVEPGDLDSIWAECDPARPRGPITELEPNDASLRARSAFYAAVTGCMLGKPLECNPTLDEIRAAAEPIGEWPLSDYVTVRLLDKLGRRHGSWQTTTRGNVRFVTPDDDINYLIIGMLMIEGHGSDWTQEHLRRAWLRNLPPLMTHGPERTFLARASVASMGASMGVSKNTGDPSKEALTLHREWAHVFNPKDEACGAAIRVDAYGYACAGSPELAAAMAWRDASMTHNRTGIYGSMYVAAAIAAAFVVDDPLDAFRIALQFVPQRSRFHEIVADCLSMVEAADDWMAGYRAINGAYGEYGHCKVYQESGHLINSAKFARSTGEALCLQVMQGCDTDCYGEIIGSIMGAYFGPGYLDRKWIAPFEDRLHTGLAQFHEQSLSRVADRMAALPGIMTT